MRIHVGLAIPFSVYPRFPGRRKRWSVGWRTASETWKPGRYAEARELLEIALREAEGREDQGARVAAALVSLGSLDSVEGRYARAEERIQRGLENP